MRLIMIPLCALLGVAGTACGPPCDRVGAGVTGISEVFTGADVPYGIRGQPLDVPFKFPTQETCNDPVAFALIDANGIKTPLEATVDREGTVDAVAHFTPREAGTFTLEATFDGPRVALRPLLIADDRTANAVTQFAFRCERLAVTASGTYLCNEHVFREGVEVNTLAAGGVREALGDVVWEDRMGELRRYTDTGTGALESDTPNAGDVGCCLDPSVLIPGEDDVLVVDSKLHRQVRNVVGGVNAAGSVDYGVSMGGVKNFVGGPLLHREGMLAFLVYQQQQQAEGCVFTLDPVLKAMDWEDATGTHPGCQPLPGTHVGASDNGIWTFAAGALVFMKPGGAALVEVARLEVPAGLSVEARNGAQWGPPRLHRADDPRVLLPRFLNGKLFVEALLVPAGFKYESARGQLAWLTSEGEPATTKVFSLRSQ